jgi:hypothetical protein
MTILTPVLSTDRILYTWSIRELGTRTQAGYSDVVATVAWTLTGQQAVEGSDTPAQAEVTGSLPVKFNPAGFTPFADLTEAQVRAWINVTLGKEKIEELQRNIADQIYLIKNPITTRSNPWSS